MSLYDKIINNKEYIDTVKQIENMKFITDGKWDWEHGLGHYKRVAYMTKEILEQLNASQRTIELGMASALLHDLGLIKGAKTDHAVESSKIFTNYIDSNDITKEEEEILRQAIKDHSKGNDIKSLVGLSLVLADKLDVVYKRTENSSIQDEMNKEIQKIRNVQIKIDDKNLIVNYETINNFDINILKCWPKAISIPYKIASILNRNYVFLINNDKVDISDFINGNPKTYKKI